MTKTFATPGSCRPRCAVATSSPSCRRSPAGRSSMATAVVSDRQTGPYRDLLDAIGNTPLVKVARLSPNPRVRIFAKLEGANPSGSVKDRIARAIIQRAEESGDLSGDRILLEPTSGNTGIGLA